LRVDRAINRIAVNREGSEKDDPSPKIQSNLESTKKGREKEDASQKFDRSQTIQSIC
jgi:hypothetical protein